MKRCVSPSFFFFFSFLFFLSLPPTQARKCGLNTIIHRTTGLCDNEHSHVGLPPEISQVFYLFFLSFFSPFFFSPFFSYPDHFPRGVDATRMPEDLFCWVEERLHCDENGCLLPFFFPFSFLIFLLHATIH